MGIGVHVEMLRRAAHACRPLVLIAIPAAITLAALVDRAPVANRIGYVVLVTTFALLAVVALTHLLDVLRRRDGDAGPATMAAVLGLVMPGMVWPLALVVLTPADDRADLPDHVLRHRRHGDVAHGRRGVPSVLPGARPRDAGADHLHHRHRDSSPSTRPREPGATAWCSSTTRCAPPSPDGSSGRTPCARRWRTTSSRHGSSRSSTR